MGGEGYMPVGDPADLHPDTDYSALGQPIGIAFIGDPGEAIIHLSNFSHTC